MEVTSENIGRLAFLRDGDLSHFILALHTPEDETQGPENAAFFPIYLFCVILRHFDNI